MPAQCPEHRPTHAVALAGCEVMPQPTANACSPRLRSPSSARAKECRWPRSPATPGSESARCTALPARAALLAALALRSYRIVAGHARAAADSEQPAPAALAHFFEQTITAATISYFRCTAARQHRREHRRAADRDPRTARTGPRSRSPRRDDPPRRHGRRHHRHRRDARPATPARSQLGTSPAAKPRSTSQGSHPPPTRPYPAPAHPSPARSRLPPNRAGEESIDARIVLSLAGCVAAPCAKPRSRCCSRGARSPPWATGSCRSRSPSRCSS